MAAKQRHFGALFDARVISLIEYRPRAQGIDILEQTDSALTGDAFESAAETLGVMLDDQGVQGGGISVVLRGHEAMYEILALPPADKAVLGPVIGREMARLHPEIPDPSVGFAFGGQLERRQELRTEPGTPQREFLSAVMPRRAVSYLGEILRDRQMRVDHLTIAPQALARLVEEVDGSREPTAAIVLLPGGPLMGFFQDGKLRLIAEPPLDSDSSPEVALQVVIDHVERGRTYLRHKFRGADVTRILFAGDEDVRENFSDALNQTLGIGVFPLGHTIGPPGAVLALGGVLDGASAEGLNLYPTEAESKIEGEKRRRTSLVWGAALVGTLAALWAAFGVLSATRNADKLKEARARADQSVAAIAPMRAVVNERQSNTVRVESLRQLRAENLRLQQHLSGVGQAAPVNVELSTMSFTRTETGWDGSLSGTAYGYSNVQSLRALSQFNMELPSALPIDRLSLDQFQYGEDGGGVPITFGMSFSVRGGADAPALTEAVAPAPPPE